jgi:hypothetical protein
LIFAISGGHSCGAGIDPVQFYLDRHIGNSEFAEHENTKTETPTKCQQHPMKNHILPAIPNLRVGQGGWKFTQS